jgi:hypothetical protein
MNFIHKPLRFAASLSLLAACAWHGAQAAPVSGQGSWESTLQARDLDGDEANGPEAWYDTDLDVTWLADANFAGTSGHVSSTHGPGGNMVFGGALMWTGSLSIGGVIGWRLPTASIDAVTGEASSAELAHLFEVTLGNRGALSNTGPFINVAPHVYWIEDPMTFKAALFDTTDGTLDVENAFRDRPALVWAVRSGDVAFATGAPPMLGGPMTPQVPEPDAVALALAGLAAAGLAMRRRVG